MANIVRFQETGAENDASIGAITIAVAVNGFCTALHVFVLPGLF